MWNVEVGNYSLMSLLTLFTPGSGKYSCKNNLQYTYINILSQKDVSIIPSTFNHDYFNLHRVCIGNQLSQLKLWQWTVVSPMSSPCLVSDNNVVNCDCLNLESWGCLRPACLCLGHQSRISGLKKLILVYKM